ncbi:MAG: universal stress protein [Thermodesulfobacteriota bacterium]|nr:universal stress protein [Thermodesulfobacteriota bacterium]
MTHQKKILVLLDGSARSELTLRFVAAMQPFKKERIVLYQVFSELPEFCLDMALDSDGLAASKEIAAWRTEQKKKMQTFLEDGKNLLVKEGFHEAMVEIKLRDRQVGVARDILAEAIRQYDLVVMRRRGSGNIAGVLLGGVTNKLLSKLPDIPVILAGRRPHNSNILISVDGSMVSHRAVAIIAEHLGGYGYHVLLLHVIRAHGLDIMPAEMLEGHRRRMLQMFDEMKERLVAHGFADGAVTSKIITGAESRADAIVEEAQAGDHNTIVVGRRGLSRVQEFLMGRVCSKVVHRGSDFTVWIV